jgi:DNA-directed RNA polymerase subunit RPC12/RpoP
VSDRPQRAILSLKTIPLRLRPQPHWKCKPCGATFQVSHDLADEDAVRCPSCNARLGKAGEFRANPPPPRVRARRVATPT